MSDIRDRVITVMASVFGLPADAIPENAAPGFIENWDSLRHMQLIVALEEAFGVRFADHEMTTLTGIPAIVGTVAAKTEG